MRSADNLATFICGLSKTLGACCTMDARLSSEGPSTDRIGWYALHNSVGVPGRLLPGLKLVVS